MQRHRSLVAYDIRESKRLRQVHRIMKGFGIPFQYSVFVCDLTVVERFDLLRQLTAVVNPAVDCVALVHLGSADDDSSFAFIGPRPVLPRSGPTIV